MRDDSGCQEPLSSLTTILALKDQWLMAYKDKAKELATSRAWWAKQPAEKKAEYKQRYRAKQLALRPPKLPKCWKFKGRETEYGREWRLAHPEQVAKRKLRERANRELRYASLAGRPKPDVCDICFKKIGNIVYDHCHKRGHFRGFLCDRCNTVLGLMEDNDTLLVAMAAYLKHNRINHSAQFALPGI
jgi:hypothetical protein